MSLWVKLLLGFLACAVGYAVLAAGTYYGRLVFVSSPAVFAEFGWALEAVFFFGPLGAIGGGLISYFVLRSSHP